MKLMKVFLKGQKKWPLLLSVLLLTLDQTLAQSLISLPAVPPSPSLSFHEEAEVLKKAMVMLMPALDSKAQAKELMDELDQGIIEKRGENVFLELKADSKALDRAREELFLSKAVLDQELNGERYLKSVQNSANVYDGEIWRRQNDQVQKEILAAKNVETIPPQIDFTLPEGNIPYGNNHFKDNFGGIARRWYRDRLTDTFVGHETPYVSEIKRKLLLVHTANETSVNLPLELLIPDDELRDDVRRSLKSCPQEVWDNFSPIEKYDIINGFLDFRATEFEKQYKGKEKTYLSFYLPFLSSLAFHKYWEGRCNAASAAGICNRHQEPVHAVKVFIKEMDRTLTLWPQDIKALLLATYHHLRDENVVTLGMRPTKNNDYKERLPNMAVLDIMLRNMLQKHHIPFIVSNKAGHAINNVSVIGFKRNVTDVRLLSEKEKDDFIMTRVPMLEKLSDYNPEAGPASWQNPKFALSKSITSVDKVMTVDLTLKLLPELPMDVSNGPTKKLLADDAASLKPQHLLLHPLQYQLYLNQEGEIIDGQLLKGELGIAWFAKGEGDEENRRGCNRYLNSEQILKLVAASKHNDSAGTGPRHLLQEELCLSADKIKDIELKLQKDRKELPKRTSVYTYEDAAGKNHVAPLYGTRDDDPLAQKWIDKNKK